MAEASITLAAGSVTVTLSHEAIEAIAREVVKLQGASTQDADAWLTVKQAAQYLGWPAQRIYNQTRVGAIPHRKHGNRLMFRRAELDDWLGGYAHGPGARAFQSCSTSSIGRMPRRIA